MWLCALITHLQLRYIVYFLRSLLCVCERLLPVIEFCPFLSRQNVTSRLISLLSAFNPFLCLSQLWFLLLMLFSKTLLPCLQKWYTTYCWTFLVALISKMCPLQINVLCELRDRSELVELVANKYQIFFWFLWHGAWASKLGSFPQNKLACFR